jgi:hypothetical protein
MALGSLFVGSLVDTSVAVLYSMRWGRGFLV